MKKLIQIGKMARRKTISIFLLSGVHLSSWVVMLSCFFSLVRSKISPLFLATPQFLNVTQLRMLNSLNIMYLSHRIIDVSNTDLCLIWFNSPHSVSAFLYTTSVCNMIYLVKFKCPSFRSLYYYVPYVESHHPET